MYRSTVVRLLLRALDESLISDVQYFRAVDVTRRG